MRDPTTRERFESFVEIDEAGCWIWQGTVQPVSGYGQFAVGSRRYQAHRIAYELFIGPIPSDLFVLHRCDVRQCANPNHLFVGTNQDNLVDAAAKGRINTQKLTADDVRALRARYAEGGISQKALAAQFGIGQSQVARIVLRQTWRFVD